ncbi:hypothetical protein D9613_004009 [Agrocybe pediades]|uniref:Uncharacterized protein n=1 Tax=Agrocybe pediades TaxID=84607 RepID=A0A8H4QIY1_9AGAR|nr:hypothetical protein D9613_004009 [Agrocybe pediades]
MSYGSSSQAGPSVRYLVQTTDVIQDMRVNVSLASSPNNIIWYKERFLSDNEIVENLVHNPTSTIQWTIHRPLRGWYIRLRSPTFPPGVFIPLTPVPQASSLHVDAALQFGTRTNNIAFVQGSSTDNGRRRWDTVHEENEDEDGQQREEDGGNKADKGKSLPTSESQFTLSDQDDERDIASHPQAQERSSTSSIHSYPPTPTITVSSHTQSFSLSSSSSSSISSMASSSSSPRTPTHRSRRPLSSSSVSSTTTNNPSTKAKSKSRAYAPPLSIPSTQITQFLLAPHQPDTTASQQEQLAHQQHQSFFARALSLLKTHRPTTSNSFCLSRIVPPTAAAQSATAASPSPMSATPLVSGGAGGGGNLSPPPYASNISLTTSPASSTTHILPHPSSHSQSQPPAQAQAQPSTAPPLLTFTDHTPLLTVRSLTGLIEVDEAEERRLGVDGSFWIAVALAYLEFLEERESYLAALSD